MNNCKFIPHEGGVQCKYCKAIQKFSTKRNCVNAPDALKLPPRTELQRLEVINTHCMPCEKVQYKGDKTDQTVFCPISSGCASSRLTPLFKRLEETCFKCGLGKRLDSKLEEYNLAIESLK